MSGIIRNMDDLGRIVPPKEMRKSLSIKDGDPVEISLENNAIVIRPLRLQCVV